MQIQSSGNALAGLVKAANTGLVNLPSGQLSELMISELMPQYYSLVKAGVVFSLNATAITPAAYTGGAAGQPVFGIYNPITSGKDIVLLQARLAIRTTGTAAVATDFNMWSVAQGGVLPTGTQTQPKNVYTQNLSGSVSYSMVNVANTNILATTLIAPSFSLGLTPATAIPNVGAFVDDVKGLVIISPGSYLAFGQSVATTSGLFDAGLVWAEIAV